MGAPATLAWLRAANKRLRFTDILSLVCFIGRGPEQVSCATAGCGEDATALATRLWSSRPGPSMSDLQIVAASTDRASRVARDIAEYLSTRILLAHELPQAPPDSDVVVDVDLDKGCEFAGLKAWLRRRPRDRKAIFAVDRANRHQTVQAYALGATSVVWRPLDRKPILDALLGAHAALLDDALAADVGAAAAGAGIRALQQVFASVVAGTRLDIDLVEIAGASIVAQIAVSGLAQWIDMMRKHHSRGRAPRARPRARRSAAAARRDRCGSARSAG